MYVHMYGMDVFPDSMLRCLGIGGASPPTGKKRVQGMPPDDLLSYPHERILSSQVHVAQYLVEAIFISLREKV